MLPQGKVPTPQTPPVTQPATPPVQQPYKAGTQYERQGAADWQAEINETNHSVMGRLAGVFTWLQQNLVERPWGYFAQWANDPQGVRDNPRAAWMAASMFGETGAYTGSYGEPMQMQALHEMRTLIAAGASREDAQAQVQSQYSTEDVRTGQMLDMVMQISTDPLNIIYPMWPAELLNLPGAAFNAASALVGGSARVGELLPATRLLPSLVETVQRTATMARWGSEPLRNALAAESAAMQALRAAEEVGRPVDQAGPLIAEALRASAEVAEIQGRGMNFFERMSVALTGGLPQTAEEAVRWAEGGAVGMLDAARAALRGDWRTAGRWGLLPNMLFRPTQVSSAQQVLGELDRVVQGITAGAHSREEIAGILTRAMESIRSGELTGILATPSGRVVATWLERAGADIDGLLAFAASPVIREQTADIANIARLIGGTADDLMGRIWNGHADETFALIREAVSHPAQGLEQLAEAYRPAIEGGQLTAETLRAFGETFRELPYTDELWRIHLMDRLRLNTATLARGLLGEQHAGFWLRTTQSLKAVETLLYLRLNPGYCVRNMWNNEATMLAWGMWSGMGAEEIARVWERAGVLDPRVYAGIGAADIATSGPEAARTVADRIRQSFGEANDIIGEAGQVGTGWVGRLVNKFTNLLPTDAGRIAQQMEQIASSRAMTSAFMDVFPQYAATGYERIPQALRGQIGEEAATALEAGLRSAMNRTEREAILFGNINVSAGNLMEETASRVGLSQDAIRGIFGADLQGQLATDLVAAMVSRNQDEMTAAVRAFSLRAEQRIDNAITGAEWAERTRQTVQIDGPMGVARVYGEGESFTNQALEIHMRTQADEISRLRALPTREERQAAWQALDTRQQAYWTRIRGVLGEQADGLARGLRESGLTVGDDFATTIRARNAAHQTFYEQRRRLTNTFYATDWADDAAETAGWRLLNDELDTAYGELVDTVGRHAETLDNQIGAVLAGAPMPQPVVANEAEVVFRRVYESTPMAEAGRVPSQEEALGYLRRLANQNMSYAAGDAHMATAIDATAAELGITSEELFGRLTQVPTIRPPVSAQQAAFDASRAQIRDLQRAYMVDVRSVYREASLLPKGEAVRAEFMDARFATRRGEYQVARYQLESGLQRQMGFPDATMLVPDLDPRGIVQAELWADRGQQIVEEMGNAAADLMTRRPLRLTNLTGDNAAAMRMYAARIEEQAPGVLVASMSHAAARRDMALLNYGMRTNFDTYSGMMFPFSFWTTHSALHWFLWSVDHPGYMATMLRFRQIAQNASAQAGVPRRLAGYIPAINLPFAPAWMGRAFVNVTGIALPMDQWIRTAENMQYDLESEEGRVMRQLDSMLESGEITQTARDEAVSTHSGDVWSMAASRVENGEDSWLDTVAMLTSPHAPIMWAFNAARGRPFQSGPFLPITRTVRGIAGMFGVDVNIEQPLQDALGLPRFDAYDEYRIQRQLADMAMEGFPTQDLSRAATDRSGPLWEEARRRSVQQYSVSAVGGLLGIPAQAYPPGEDASRDLAQQFGLAVEAEDGGQEGAIGAFLNEHPEVGLRLGLSDTPTERIQRFLVDQIWNGWNQMPSFNQREIVEQFGPLFEQAILNPETRSYDSVPAEVLGMWARALGGEPLGSLPATQATTMALSLTPRDVTERIQVFYDTRNQYFDYDQIRATQDEYFAIDESQRAAFRQANPELMRYWDWRRQFLYNNPALIDYLVEDPSTFAFPTAQAYEQAVAAQPNFQWAEWYSYLGPNLSNLVLDWNRGEVMPAAAEARLREMATDLGIEYDALLERLRASLAAQ